MFKGLFPDLSLTGLLELVWDEEVIAHTVAISKLYAAQKEKVSFEISPEKIRAFLCVPLLSDHVPYPYGECFWGKTVMCITQLHHL